MTLTVIVLLSIVFSIVGSNTFGYLKPNYDLGFSGNTIAAVFGGVFFIKSFGRLGFNPKSIMASGEVDFVLLAINLIVSVLGGVLAVYLGVRLKHKMNR